MGMHYIKERVAEVSEMPKDIIMDAPRVIITGNFQLNIENHRGLMEYTCDRVRVNTSIGVFRITGANLTIKNIAPDEIVIAGNIENIDISS